VILEYINLKKILERKKAYFKVEPKLLENVSSGIDDTHFGGSKRSDSFSSKWDPNQKKTLETLVRKITSLTGDQSTQAYVNQLKEEELMKASMRRCRSFKELREVDGDFGPDEDDE